MAEKEFTMKKFFADFKAFIAKGNVIDMAVGVVIGGAFGKIVTALVNNIIMPLVGLLTGGTNIADLQYELAPAVVEMVDGVPVEVTPANILAYGLFIQTIIEPASAAARGWKRPTMTHSDTDMSNKNKLASAFQAIAEALGLKMSMEAEEAPVGYVLTSQDGTEINIDKPEGEDPAVGDAATPDGEHLMPDGTTIVIADGVITEIRDAEAEDTEEPEAPETEEAAEESAEDAHAAEMAAKDAEIAGLQARIAELEGAQMSADQEAILAKVEKAGGAAWLDKTLKSNYKPAARERNEQTAPKASKLSDDLAAAKAKKAAAKRKTV